MANDAEPYIAAVADACQKAGLLVADYWSDDIDPRDGCISLTLDPDADLEDPEGEEWQQGRTLGWDEVKGWFYGEPKDHHGELCNLLFFGDGPLPAPADVAETARRITAGEVPRDERFRMIDHVRWRDHEAEDPEFEAALAAYRDATPATGGE